MGERSPFHETPGVLYGPLPALSTFRVAEADNSLVRSLLSLIGPICAERCSAKLRKIVIFGRNKRPLGPSAETSFGGIFFYIYESS